MNFDQLLNSGAIRIFDTTGFSLNGLDELVGDPRFVAEPDNPEYQQISAALEKLYNNSAKMELLLDSLSPQSALWIDLDHKDNEQPSGLNVDDPSLNLRGFVKIRPDIQARMINEFGFYEDVSVERTLAHEISHALLETLDVVDDLANGNSNTDYRGSAVDFENDVVREMDSSGFFIGTERTSYWSLFSTSVALDIPLGPDDELRTSWTDGQPIDIVHINGQGSPSANLNNSKRGGYTSTIDTSNASSDYRDLVIASNNSISDAQNISTGIGEDYIYAFRGKDVIDAGEGNDYIDGGAGDDNISGGAGDDVILGGSDQDTLKGEVGNDRLHGGDGADTIDGGQGVDFLKSSPSAGVTVNLMRLSRTREMRPSV